MSYVIHDPNGRSKKDVLKEQLEALDKEYRDYEAGAEVKIPESLGLVEKPVDYTTDGDISSEVTQKHSAEKDAGIEKLTAESEVKKGEVSAQKDEVVEEGEAEVEEIGEAYREARLDLEDDASKRGLLTSSIYDGERGALDDGEVEDIRASVMKTENAVSALDLEIELLNQRLERDLEEFNIAHAAKLSKEIDKLIAERDRKNASAISYNNTLKQKEAEYQKKRKELIEQAQKEAEEKERYELEHGYTGKKKENYLARYDLARKYYKSLPRDRALEEIRGDTFVQQYLGYYYQKLVDELVFAKG